MKRLLLILPLMLLLFCTACSNMDYSEATVNLAENTDAYKTYGRTYVTPEGLNIDFAGNGMEFEVECGGDVYATYTNAEQTYFQVFVDGEVGIRFYTTPGDNQKIRIAQDLPDGVHNIRIIRDTDATKDAEIMAISKISFTGKVDTFKAPADKELYIEFVGDSITAGKYTEIKDAGSDGIDNAPNSDGIHKATNSYAYLTAEALNADFSVVAKGGCGYFRVSTCPKTMNQLYPYYNGFAKEPVPYTANRKADVVVLALGTNDKPSNVTDSFLEGIVPFETYDDALADQICQIREMHGEDVPIVLIYGMMNAAWEENFQRASDTENVYILKVTKNREGGRNHPSAEGHEVIAAELTKFLQDNVLK